MKLYITWDDGTASIVTSHAQIAAKHAAGISDVEQNVEPSPEWYAAHLAGSVSTTDLRLWDYVAGTPPARAELVDFTNPAHMRVGLVPSVTIDLQCRITRIDWLAPDATPADPFGERFAGVVVLVELRDWTEGPLGPVGRTDTLQALLRDGSVGEAWTRGKRYDGRVSATRGDQRRRECVSRLTTWLGVAAAAVLGGDADAAVLQISAWGATVTAERAAFEDRADPGGLIAAIQAADAPWWSVPCAAIGLDVGAGPTVRDAVLASLATWAPA